MSAWTARLVAQLSVSLLCFILTAGLLWFLRKKGPWTLLAGLVLEIALLVPVSFYAYDHNLPVVWGAFSGIMTGCNMAMIGGLLLHVLLRRQ